MSTAHCAQKVHFGHEFEPVLGKSNGRQTPGPLKWNTGGYTMEVGFTLLLALGDLQGGVGQHPQPLASGFDDKGGRG